MIRDLSHRIHDGMPAYPGLPAARVTSLVTHEASRERYQHQAEFCMTHLSLAGNTGTYLDAPYHRYRKGIDVADLPLDRLVDLEVVVVDADPRHGRALTFAVDQPPVSGRAVLIRTGWDRRWGTDAYWEPGPYLTRAIAEELVGADPALVGVDFWNVDDPDDRSRPAHTALLHAGIPIVEHLRGLDQLPGRGARFSAVPLAVVGAASVPIRAFARVEG